eukprot:12250263-Alexandrium_andersonii.AAC.1
MGDWQASWRHTGVYAGAPGQGAMDAWGIASLLNEHAQTQGWPTMTTTVDIYKAFDQANRSVVFGLLALAGAPLGPLTAYISFMQAAIYHNSLSFGVGQGHLRACSIPQGCPWSMMVFSLMQIPWHRMIEDLFPETLARSLADDMLLSSGTGEDLPPE